MTRRPLIEINASVLIHLAFIFLKLGATAFGGPAAHIAIMQKEFVDRRKWLTGQEFLDLISASNLIPGPNSTEMAMHIGYKQCGLMGLFIAGISFILPAALLVTGIAWLYTIFSTMPQVSSILYGIKPVIIGIILQALLGLGRIALKTNFLLALFAILLISSFLGLDEILLLLISGTISLVWTWHENKQKISLKYVFASSFLTILIGLSYFLRFSVFDNTLTPMKLTLLSLFYYFAKVGGVLYGSGYVLLAFLRHDLVDHLQWLTTNQLLDATAIGQITPGPVFTTATFIGFLLKGPSGAIVATVAIFLPAFIFVALSAPIINKLRQSQALSSFLDGVNAGSLCLMSWVTWQLALSAIVDPICFALALISFILLLRAKINITWLMLLGAVLGLLIKH